MSAPAGKSSLLSVATLAASGIVAVLAVAAIVQTMGRGLWLDEFFTLSMTQPDFSPAEVFGYLKRDVHPALPFILAYVEQVAGITEAWALRLANIIGAPCVAAALWFAMRRDALTQAQAMTLAVLCASAWAFVGSFAEVRGYFLLACASVSVAVLWRVADLRIARGERIDSALLAAWGLGLAAFVNLHYFGTLMGGLLTAALLVGQVRRRAWADAVSLALVSLAAAAPAVALAGIQMGYQPEKFWIMTTPRESLRLMGVFLGTVAVNNIPASVLGAFAFVLALVRPGARRSALSDNANVLRLAGVTLVFFVLLFVVNLARPIVVLRYLVVAIGPVLLGAAVLSAGRNAPKWAPLAVAAYAAVWLAAGLATGTNGLAFRTKAHTGWDVSAKRARELAQACTGSRIYTQPAPYLWLDETHPQGVSEGRELGDLARRYGHGYYSQKLGLSATMLAPGDVLAPSDGCPAILWVEHGWGPEAAPVDRILAWHGLAASGAVATEKAGSGELLVVR